MRTFNIEKEQTTWPVDTTWMEWTPASWICLETKADGNTMPTLLLDFLSPDKILTIRFSFIPSCWLTLAVRLDELDSHRFFLPTYPGMYKCHVEGEPIDFKSVTAFRIRIPEGASIPSFRRIYLNTQSPDFRIETSRKMVDALGQRIEGEWPEKVKNATSLVSYLQGERKKAQARNQYPEGWDAYGGWKQIKFDATGFFHTHYNGKRWYLVDPLGNVFFSNCICYGARLGVFGFADGLENLFEELPSDTQCWTTAIQIPEYQKRYGTDMGGQRKLCNFARANMILAFGDSWRDAWREIATSRMKKWGFNTIGVGVNTYEDDNVDDFLKKADMPFVVTLKDFPKTKHMIYRDFPDVFSKEYTEASNLFATRQLRKYKKNPWMIGYFITNEPEWLFQQSVNPAKQLLSTKENLESRKELERFLKKRYQTISKMNEIWNTAFVSFEQICLPTTFTEQAEKDMVQFRNILIHRYCQVPSEAAKKADPDHMNLGMRYNRLTPDEFAGNAEFDVCSFNCYRLSPLPMLDIAKAEDIKRPAIIGEWHITANDGRAFVPGLVSVQNQKERAEACRNYIEQAAAHPCCIGIHYFEMNDQPLLGRFDGECMQHGLVSVCNVPYEEMDAMLQQEALKLYPLITGTLEKQQKESL